MESVKSHKIIKEPSKMQNNTSKTYDKVVELLNNASLMTKDSDKLINLKIVEELIISKEPALLDNFLDEVLAFQNDRSIEVKKYIIHFMEEAGKTDVELLFRIVSNLLMMITDPNVAVIKKLILCMSQIYKTTFKWVASSKTVTEIMRKTWSNVTQLQAEITRFIDSDNEGLRTHAIKFLETIVITLSKPSSEFEEKKVSNVGQNINLGLVIENHSYFKVDRLEDEGKLAFQALLVYQSSMHISSINLMTCMGSMTNIARHRPEYISQIMQGFEGLHVNLPPTLSKSQVSSVRKSLKIQMFALLRLPSSLPFQTNISILLTDLGATQAEVLKNMPKLNDRKRKLVDVTGFGKKLKPDLEGMPLNDDDDDYSPMTVSPIQTNQKPINQLSDSTESNLKNGSSNTTNKLFSNNNILSDSILGNKINSNNTGFGDGQPRSAVDITAGDLVGKLIPQNVTDLVLLSMVMLPDQMPVSFQLTYTPIAAAGTQVQINHLARMLATQLNNVGLGKGFLEVQEREKQKVIEKEELKQISGFDDEDYDDNDELNSKQTIETLGGGSAYGNQPSNLASQLALNQPAVQSTRKGIVQFKLSSVTKPMSQESAEAMALQAMKRILYSDKLSQPGNMNEIKSKIVINLASQFDGPLRDELLRYIFDDLRNRSDMALLWMYHEFSNFQGYTTSIASGDVNRKKLASEKYDECITMILKAVLNKPDQKEGLFSRFILEVPHITSNILLILKEYCQCDSRIYLGMTTLKELIVKRPSMKMEFLDILLTFTLHEKLEVRQNAIRVTKKLHERPDLQGHIEEYAMKYLKYLLLSNPPKELGTKEETENPGQLVWTDDNIRLCLYLYLGLLPVNHKLIHELALVYTSTTGDIKRTILRVLETPVKGMGMESPELLLLVENCPKGAETFVTRVIHILTDKAVPSPQLVDRVRDLYQKRVSDVRFLIPVLNGLTKKEVVAALPKLIKLNPIVVKEVFNRLLGVHGQGTMTSSLNPTELLITLHTLDTSKVDMKTIIKACTLCFAEKNIYTQEVLAVVMQQLMEITPLPTLLMRTVIQSLATYPKLSGMVMNIMQRLITKQVWKNKKVWEGFVKCCQRTKPQSFQVLLQLPPVQLKDVFILCPELREPLLTHVQAFTPHQRAHISKSIMSVLEKSIGQESCETHENTKKMDDEKTSQEKLNKQKMEDDKKKHELILKLKNGAENRAVINETIKSNRDSYKMEDAMDSTENFEQIANNIARDN